MASKRHVSKPARDIQFVVNLKRVKKMNEKESGGNISLKTIESVGYDKDKRTLEILFGGSGVYTYFDVSKKVYQELVTADSVGTYFHQNILNKFKYEKVDKNY